MLKMCLLAKFYDLTGRQAEIFANENLPAKYFIGLGLDHRAPDHSTLSVFRDHLINNGSMQILEGILDKIIAAAQQSGIKFGSIQIIDSVHCEADVITSKDQSRKDEGKGPRDQGAQWGVKGKQKFKDQQGKDRHQVKHFYGYKGHMSMNAENNLITSLGVTSGEVYDGHHFCSLVAHDLAQNLTIETYAADHGYDDGNNHFFLQEHHLNSAICLKDIRTKKKDANKQIWLDMIQTSAYKQGRKELYKIERKFGEAKQNHGLARCCYLGLLKFGVQAYFTALALNMKNIVKLQTGVGLKTRRAVLS
ncbi:MAG TPA: hypothetical protein DCL08_01925 [Anaerolineaceae bacterium]|nr:hypothetical protein [Anaerolineaceae bacterium]